MKLVKKLLKLNWILVNVILSLISIRVLDQMQENIISKCLFGTHHSEYK